jgi:transcriptional regulator with XRE-family HTH domain
MELNKLDLVKLIDEKKQQTGGKLSEVFKEVQGITPAQYYYYKAKQEGRTWGKKTDSSKTMNLDQMVEGGGFDTQEYPVGAEGEKETSFYSKIGTSLKETRNQLDLTIGELAEITGLNPVTISRIEAGKRCKFFHAAVLFDTLSIPLPCGLTGIKNGVDLIKKKIVKDRFSEIKALRAELDEKEKAMRELLGRFPK